MKRPPFDVSGPRGAQARRAGGRTITGRASFVWLHGVIVPIACGVADDGVEIRRRSPDGPWHRITYTPDEAYRLLVDRYPMQGGLRRKVEAFRRRNGLEVDA